MNRPRILAALAATSTSSATAVWAAGWFSQCLK